MEFSPFNPIVKRCLQGMELERNGKTGEAAAWFLQTWNEASGDLEKFLAAYYVARHQDKPADCLHWLQTALQLALAINDDGSKSALPSLYLNIANSYARLNQPAKEKEFHDLAVQHRFNPSDKGPFYHGTKADLKVGDLLHPGGVSNYKPELKMNHIYFTAMVNGAGLAAALANGAGSERVYCVEPTGSYENDPNVTDKKFPGNPTRSYRSDAPLRIIAEVLEWQRPNPEDLKKFREKLSGNQGEIIN